MIILENTCAEIARRWYKDSTVKKKNVRFLSYAKSNPNSSLSYMVVLSGSTSVIVCPL